MRHNRRHAWLFSFTDIAFLLLMVFTQFGRMNASNAPVAEMRLPAPVVVKNPELATMTAEREYRQVLVEAHSPSPYRVAHIRGGNELSRSSAMTFAELSSALRLIQKEREAEPRPVVVPLPDSYSSDLLQAAALVGQLWHQDGSAVVHTNKSEGKT